MPAYDPKLISDQAATMLYSAAGTRNPSAHLLYMTITHDLASRRQLEILDGHAIQSPDPTDRDVRFPHFRPRRAVGANLGARFLFRGGFQGSPKKRQR